MSSMVNTSNLLDYILKISKLASTEVIGMNEKKPLSRFIIPQKRDSSYRLSEQEFRIATINAIQCYNDLNLDLYFSVETPTHETHMISGDTPMSARFDLSLFEQNDDGYKKVADIEFKSHNATKHNIIKDLHKLIKEGNTGAWFHVLQNCDSGTLKSLFDKFACSLLDLTQPGSYGLKPEKEILFVFLVVDRRLMISKILTPFQLSNPTHCFSIDYQQMLATQSNHNVNDWMISKL